jgi:hypothetical protein
MKGYTHHEQKYPNRFKKPDAFVDDLITDILRQSAWRLLCAAS